MRKNMGKYRVKRGIVLFAVLALRLSCWPQTKAASPEKPVFRSPFVLKLHVDEKRYYEQPFESVPYVADGNVYLFKGENFGVNVTAVGGRLSVSYERDTAKADVEFMFTQEKAQDGYMMLLVTQNRLRRKLLFDALMTVPGKPGIIPTSILPVEPMLASYESWPHPIVQLVLTNFRFSAANGSK
jgi:hypothetical protein